MRNTIGNNLNCREQLEQKSNPVAILHSGMYVFANSAYLELLGYKNFSDIEGIPALSMVDEHDRKRFKKHFGEAVDTSLEAPTLPSAQFSLVRVDGSHLRVTATSHSYMLDGEPCIEMWLATRKTDVSPKRPSSKPWSLYLGLAMLALLTLLPPVLLPNLNINNDPKVNFPKNEPAFMIDKAVREKFPNDQVYILLFESTLLFSEKFLIAYDQLDQQLKRHRLVKKVYGLTSQDHIAGSEDGFFVEPVINIRKLETTTPASRQQQAIADRFSRGALVSSDGDSISMIVVPVTLDSSIQRLQLEEEILDSVKKAQLDEYLVAKTGFIPLDIAELRSMLRDNKVFIPATAIIGLMLIWLMFRRWLAVVLGGLSINAVVGSTVAIYVLVGEPFTLISSIVPPLLSALTVAALVHFYNALHYSAQRGLTNQARVRSALKEIQRPALFTALTTAAGLMSLAASPIPSIKTFGLISAVGVLLIYLVVIILLPPLFIRWDKTPWPNTKTGLHVIDVFVKHLYRVGIRYPHWVIALTIVGLTAGIPALWEVKVETNLQEFFTPDHPIRRDTDYFEATMSGTGTLDVVFETQQQDGQKKPEYLTFMRNFQTWAEHLPEVDKTVSPADFIEEMHWGFNAEDPEFRRIPDNPELVSQYLFIYAGDDLFDFIDDEFRTSRVNLSINVHPANEIAALMEKIRDYLDNNAPAELQWEIAGNSRLFADMEDLLVKGQVYSLWGALILIFLLMLFLWRSLGSALLCMIPNISPILLIFIVMGLFGLWLDMATAMIASVAVGIAVDDTIHIYHGYMTRIKAGAQPVQALARTFSQAGRAVVTTTIILSAQFMILILSLFQPTAHFGMLTSVGLWAALLFDLLLLPAILITLFNYKSGKADCKSLV